MYRDLWSMGFMLLLRLMTTKYELNLLNIGMTIKIVEPHHFKDIEMTKAIPAFTYDD